jgi:WD40 repeat protein
MKQNVLRTFSHPAGEVGSAVFLNGNRNLVTTGFDDGSVKIWDIFSSGQPEVVLQHVNYSSCLAVSPDYHWLVSGDPEGLRVFDLYKWSEASAWGPQESVHSVAFDPLSRRVAVYYHHLVQISDIQSQVVWCNDIHTSGWTDLHVTFTPDGDELLLTDFYYTETSPKGGGTGSNLVQRWSLGSGRVMTRYRSPNGIRRFSVSPCGLLIAATCYDDRTRIWDLCSGQELQSIPVNGWPIAFHPHQRLLAIGYNNMVTLWHLDKRCPLIEFEGASLWSMADQLAFSPDGSLLAASGKSAAIWSVNVPSEPPHKGNAPAKLITGDSIGCGALTTMPFQGSSGT